MPSTEAPLSAADYSPGTAIPSEIPPNGHMILYHENFKPIHDFKGKHILSAKQFDLESLETIFSRASQIEELLKTPDGRMELQTWLQPYILAALFYQSSTRTKSHFVMGMQRLGGKVFTEDDITLSSRFKGEPFAHTVRILEGGLNGADAAVIRDPQGGFHFDIMPYATKPIINAGDGDREHPTQALKDYFIKRKDFGTLNGMTVTYFGDIRHGRTVHSSALLDSLHQDVTINFVAPGYLRAPREMVGVLQERGVLVNEFQSLSEMEEAGQEPGQALYATRLQTNLIKDQAEASPSSEEKGRLMAIISNLESMYKEGYSVTPEFMNRHPDTFLYHPLPIDRSKGDGEIPPSLDFHPRSRFFAQSDGGIPIAGAILDLVMRGNPVN